MPPGRVRSEERGGGRERVGLTKRLGKVGASPGGWTALPLELVRSRAFASLSPKATKLFLDLVSLMGPGGKLNGDLSAAPTVMGRRGWRSNADRVAALQELIDAELLVVTRHGSRRLTTLYALTPWPLGAEVLPKLEVRPGCYRRDDWKKTPRHAEDVNREGAEPAQWSVPRRGENASSAPTVGTKPADLNPRWVQ